MQKSNKLKSTVRKPLIDVSDGRKSTRVYSKKTCSSEDVDVGALDRLLLVRSDLSNLFGQIEELVAEALGRTSIDRKVSQDIESFRNVLHDMQSTLKPWVTRLQHSLASTAVVEENQPNQILATQTTNSIKNENNIVLSKNKKEAHPIVSPSPLVSWRTGSSVDSCKIEDGKQLFLLTPLPKPEVAPSKLPGSSKTIARALHENANKQKIVEKSLSKFAASSKTIARILHENAKKQKYEEKSQSKLPGSSSENVNKQQAEEKSHLVESKKEPFPTLTTCLKKASENNSKDSNNSKELISNDVVLKDLTSRHQDLLRTKPDDENGYTKRRRNFDHTFDWFLSPPKTCVIMEPNDDKEVPTPMVNGNAVPFMVTPLFKDVESTIMKGKKAGETTLKRELWARFEEASKDGVHFDKSVSQKPARMGFMDMLEEACESECGDVK